MVTERELRTLIAELYEALTACLIGVEAMEGEDPGADVAATMARSALKKARARALTINEATQ